MNALQEVVNRFPDSAYARDARLKIDLCRDHLAGKEMEIGRWYESQHLYEAAIGRFQRVVDDYQTTNHVPEALHRLTEIYLILGLRDQARKTAVGAGLQLPRQPLVRGQLQRPVRRRAGAAAGTAAPAGQTAASSPAPGTRSSEPQRQQAQPHAHRPLHPRRGADRAAGPVVRRRPDRADRRDRRRQVDPARQPRPRAGRAGGRRTGARGRRAGQRHRLLRAARRASGRRRCWPSRGWRPRTRSCCAAC